jgi:hypothetical protein
MRADHRVRRDTASALWLFSSPHLEPVSPVFWLMMQIGMVLGLLTTSPMNRWLVGAGLKEKMG